MQFRYQASVSLNKEEADLLQQVPSHFRPKDIFLAGVYFLIKQSQEPRQDAPQDTIASEIVQSIDQVHEQHNS